MDIVVAVVVAVADSIVDFLSNKVNLVASNFAQY